MTAVFVGGSRRITSLPVEVKTRIDNVVHNGFSVLVGDANGADKAVQRHLAESQYEKVTVFCSGNASRNNVGHWETHNVSAEERKRSFHFYAAKDREMAKQADFGLMIWDGESPGTVLNILRLVQTSKMAVLVSVFEKTEVEFKCKKDWDVFLSRCSLKLRRDLERRATHNESSMLRQEQDDFFSGVSGKTDEVPDGPIAWGEFKSKMEAALGDGDSKAFVELLGKLARQRGMSHVAKETGLAREALYRALSSDGNPEFATIVKVTMALGLTLCAMTKAEESAGVK